MLYQNTKEEVREYWEQTLREVFRSLYSAGDTTVRLEEVRALMRKDEYNLAVPILGNMVKQGSLEKEKNSFLITKRILGYYRGISVGDMFRKENRIIIVTGFTYRGKPYSTLGDFVKARSMTSGRATTLKRDTLSRDYVKVSGRSVKGLFSMS